MNKMFPMFDANDLQVPNTRLVGAQTRILLAQSFLSKGTHECPSLSKMVNAILENKEDEFIREFELLKQKDARHAAQDLMMLATGKGDTGTTCLHVACGHGMRNVVKMLLDADGTVNAKTNKNLTPLSYAVGFGHYEIVKMLLEKDAEVKGRPILYACYRGYDKIVELLLEKKASPGEIDAVSKCTPMITALACKQFRVADRLIKYAREHSAGKEILSLNVASNAGSALQHAILHDHEEIVTALLELKADPNVKIANSFSNLVGACNNENSLLVRKLVEYKADVNHYYFRDDRSGGIEDSPMIIAVVKKSKSLIKLLIKLEADVNIKIPPTNRTILFRAVGLGVKNRLHGGDRAFEKISKFLVSQGADCDIRDNTGKTIWDIFNETPYMANARLLEPFRTGLYEARKEYHLSQKKKFEVVLLETVDEVKEKAMTVDEVKDKAMTEDKQKKITQAGKKNKKRKKKKKKKGKNSDSSAPSSPKPDVVLVEEPPQVPLPVKKGPKICQKAKENLHEILPPEPLKPKVIAPSLPRSCDPPTPSKKRSFEDIQTEEDLILQEREVVRKKLQDVRNVKMNGLREPRDVEESRQKEDLREQLELQNSMFDELREQLEELRQELKAARKGEDEAKQRSLNLQTQVMELLQDQAGTSRSELEAARNQIKYIEHDRDLARQKNSDLAREVANARQQNVDFVAELNELKDTVDRLDTENRMLRFELDRSEQTTQQDMVYMRADLRSCKTELQRLKVENMELKSKDSSHLELELVSMRREVKLLEQQRDTLREQNSRLNIDVTKVICIRLFDFLRSQETSSLFIDLGQVMPFFCVVSGSLKLYGPMF